MGLARTFLEAWAGAGAEAPLEPALLELRDRARRAWPSLAIEDDTFIRFVAARIPVDADPVQQLKTLSAGDLYLACGCSHGSEQAALEFRAYVAAAVGAAIRRAGLDSADDLAQELYRHLFLPEPGRAPKIWGYAGQGDLRRWVGIVATRMAIDSRRRTKTSEAWDDELMDRVLDSADSSEFEHLRREYRQHFKSAFGVAVSGLSARDRNVLRYHFDGLTADQIGRMHGAHRVTVARWLSRIRFELLEQTRAALRDRLGTTKAEVVSIMRMLEGEISLSIDRLLASRG